MTRFADDIHTIVGALGQEPIGRPGIVVVVPDYSLPQPRAEGPLGYMLAANAGFRSEIQIAYYSATDPNHGVELSDIWVRPLTALADIEAVQVVSPGTGGGGYTDVPFKSGDAAYGKPMVRMFTRNNAAAHASTFLLARTSAAATAGDWVKMPGIIRLRGKAWETSVLFRTTADNQSIGVKCHYRELEKRSL